jgi:hypothetical protein
MLFWLVELLDLCFESVMHNIPVIPKERHVIMNDQFIQSLSLLDDLSEVVLGSLVLEGQDLPRGKRNDALVKPVCDFVAFLVLILY